MNSQYEFDFLVFIGRFQPFHNAHLKVVQEGLSKAKHLVVLVGSAHRPRCARNPWASAEREAMIRGALSEADNLRLSVAPLMDATYNDDIWVRNVQRTVNGLVTAHHDQPQRAPKIGLIGHSKDRSSYYLKLFPQWGSVNVITDEALSATPIRACLFQSDAKAAIAEVSDSLPPNVTEFITDFSKTGDFGNVLEEVKFVNKYKSAWASAPYEPMFVTVDAVVVQSGHVLLVERKAQPGRGLLALPGGFLDPNERLAEACVRELREETRLKLPEAVLFGSIKSQQVFDDPHRSLRGRTVTHAFHIDLKAAAELPKVKGGDDARHAMWVPLAALDPKTMFEDHYFIIQSMLGA